MKTLLHYILITGLCIVVGCQKPTINLPVATSTLDPEVAEVLINLAAEEGAISANIGNSAAALNTTIQQLVATPTAANLAASQAAWIAARAPWESNESFAFGPVETNNIDPNVDDWPVSVADIHIVLNTTTTIDEAYIQGLATTAKGYHTIEYLLFGQTHNQTIDSLTPRKLAYLSALGNNLAAQTALLKADWAGGSINFRANFVAAGTSASTYGTQKDAILDVISSMADILDELPNTKIEGAASTGNNAYSESAFSDNSLTDYKNNLASVKAAYIGIYDTLSGKGISTLVALKNPALDVAVRQQIEVAASALNNIPQPFSVALTTSKPQITKVQAELNKLHDLIANQITPLLSEE